MLSLVAGCAAERDPINKVQPNVLKKADFIGDLANGGDNPEFYWRNFVVDTSVNQSHMGIGTTSGVDRIRFEITEDKLLAHKAYQTGLGEDGRADRTKAPDGAVVASFRIKEHFDIKHDYNPTTGEQYNVLVENQTDRPWNEREFFRVDWGSNEVLDPNWGDMFLGKIFGWAELTPMTYSVTDPGDRDAPHMEELETQGYFDVTNMYYVSPKSAGNDLPECVLYGFYTGSTAYTCDPAEATVRMSFWKVDPAHDYERLENTRAYQDIVGNFGGAGVSYYLLGNTSQQGWDPGYGYTDALFHRFMIRHNNWVKSHQAAACSSNLDANANGTADQCENAVTGYAGSQGSQCDEFDQRCTLPLRDRAIRAVTYFVNAEVPAELLDAAEASAAAAPTARGVMEEQLLSWNQLMRNALASAREVECRRTGDGDRAACHAAFFNPDKVMLRYGAWLIDDAKATDTVITLCHNPVRAYDDPACGKAGEVARLGDVRKNFVIYWPYESHAPYGGVANIGADPLTGEAIGVTATIMGRSATMAAARQRDALLVAMGDLTIDDYMAGVPSQTYAKILQRGFGASGRTPEQLASAQKAFDVSALSQRLAGVNRAPMSELTAKQLSLVASTRESAEQQVTDQAEFDGWARKLWNTPFEASLIDTRRARSLLGLPAGANLDEAMLDQASVLRGMDSSRLSHWRESMSRKLAAMGYDLFDAEAPLVGGINLPSLAGYFKAKYQGLDPKARGEAVYRDLWLEATKGLGIHEIGHSLGLRHQFSSSWDSLNYFPQYWQLRTGEKAAQETADCEQPRAEGSPDTCMGPRYKDPETADELGLGEESRPAITYFGNTSVMEYQIDRFAETVGLGQYDQHAMNSVYGAVLQTVDAKALGLKSAELEAAIAEDLESLSFTQLTESNLVRWSVPEAGGKKIVFNIPYTKLARLTNIFDPARCRPATEAEKALAGWRIVHGKVCAPVERDVAAWQDFTDGTLEGTPERMFKSRTRAEAGTGGNAIRWAYRVGEVYGNSYLHAVAFDAGADPYEVTMNQLRAYEMSYPSSYFRRGDRMYLVTSPSSGTVNRVFERVRSYHWQIAKQIGWYGLGWVDSDNLLAPYVQAGQAIFGLYHRAAVMPEPMEYRIDPVRTGPDQTQLIYDTGDSYFASDPAFSVGVVDGRYLADEFDNGIGGSWDYQHWASHVGFDLEKSLAIRAIADGRATLSTISRENYLDGRLSKISFRDDMPRAVDRLMGGLLAEDWETVGTYVPAQSQPGEQLSPQVIDLTGEKLCIPTASQGRILFSNVGYSQQSSMAILASLFSRQNTDMILMNKLRVFVDGVDGPIGASGIPDASQVRFTDPRSGYTYVARRYGDEPVYDLTCATELKTIDRGIASRMLQHANALLANAYWSEPGVGGKPKTDAYGRPELSLDGSGQPVINDAAREAELVKYVGLLDTLRQVGATLGGGPMGGASSGGGEE
ncbi:MAG TPA: hypothetical protein VGK67_37085 [Myxococcales bacterium]